MKKIFILFLTAILLSLNTVCLADPTSDIDISLVKIPLNSKLNNGYKGYQYTIQNNGQDLNLVNARVINGSDGSLAYNTLEKGHPIAKMWLICYVVGFFTLGLGWGAGIVATPIVWAGSSINNLKARHESDSYSNLVNLGELKKGDIITVRTLVPISQQPSLKLNLKDEKTGQLYSIYK